MGSQMIKTVTINTVTDQKFIRLSYYFNKTGSSKSIIDQIKMYHLH